MKSSEKRWILGVAIVLMLVTSIPYLLGFAAEDDDWRFTGFVYGVEDGNSYIAKMELGAHGEWLFRTPYSAEPQSGVVAFLPYILLGKVAGGTAIHTQLVALYHLLRVAAIPVALFATYSFASIFTKKVFWRRWITILASVGGGVGWVFLLFGIEHIAGSLPLEWYSPEWFGFLSYYGQPHLLLARGLLLSGLTFYLCAPYRAGYGWRAGLIFLTLSLVHPLSLVSAGAVVGSHQFAVYILAAVRRRWNIALRWLKVAVRAFLPPLPIVIYTAIKFSTDPFLKQWTEQNKIISPSPVHIFIAYGLMMPWILVGINSLLRRRRWSGLLPLMWVMALPVLAYAPHNLQRRLPEGVWIAILILAMYGFVLLSTKTIRLAKWLGNVWIILSVPTSILLIVGGIRVTQMPSLPVFRPSAEVEVFDWLGAHAAPYRTVLSSFETGNALPAWAPLRVLIGHGPESVDLENLRSFVTEYYQGQIEPDQVLEVFENYDISYIFYGPQEVGVGEIMFGELVFQSGSHQLYEVRSP